MKISELENAPQWLLDADTKNADVEMDGGVVIWRSGDWLGGDWLGGDWLGGVWLGGVWLGGVWRGGDWRDGVWLGGVWLGGVWRGGDWLDGVWWDGVWRDGVWRGGDWLGGVWRDETCKKNLLNVLGLKWPITISDTRMQIGCEIHPFSAWEEFDDARIVKMDHGALKFWRQHKDALLSLCNSRLKELP